ncbi:MAG: glycosyltransferase family 1 protein [Patescibacteria group bacterium]
MKVGIDARMYGPRVGGGGLGRYTEQLVNELQKIDQKNRYILFTKPENFEDLQITNNNFEKKKVNIHWYTLKEQVLLGPFLDKQKCDLVHFPHWNVPLGLKTPFVVTIHDLILLDEPRSAKATTKNPFIYSLKYLGYKKVLKHAIESSKHIIAVSNFTKESILKHFPHVPENKITVVYEGVTKLTNNQDQQPHKDRAQNLLYIGNAYPHKNLEKLLLAFKKLLQIKPNCHLTLAGKNDVFYQRTKEASGKMQIPESKLTFKLDPTDSELVELYASACIYVFPSRMEGFGLPALEAMQAGVPIACAHAGSLPEIVGSAAEYFSPNNTDDIAQTLGRLLSNQQLRENLVQRGFEQIQKYSWTEMAERIIDIYNKQL